MENIIVTEGYICIVAKNKNTHVSYCGVIRLVIDPHVKYKVEAIVDYVKYIC